MGSSERPPDILTALRLPELYRKVCLYAGLPLSPALGSGEQFVFRSGAELPGLLAALLEEAFVEDEAEVAILPAEEPPDYHGLLPGHVAIRPGFDTPCPVTDELTGMACPAGGRAILLAVERRDGEGQLLGLTWAAIPEGEPAPEAAFRAAVIREVTTESSSEEPS